MGPVEDARRAQRKAEMKKNKQRMQEQRTAGLLKQRPEKLKHELDRLRRQEEQGVSSNKSKARLKVLEDAYNKIVAKQRQRDDDEGGLENVVVKGLKNIIGRAGVSGSNSKTRDGDDGDDGDGRCDDGDDDMDYEARAPPPPGINGVARRRNGGGGSGMSGSASASRRMVSPAVATPPGLRQQPPSRLPPMPMPMPMVHASQTYHQRRPPLPPLPPPPPPPQLPLPPHQSSHNMVPPSLAPGGTLMPPTPLSHPPQQQQHQQQQLQQLQQLQQQQQQHQPHQQHLQQQHLQQQQQQQHLQQQQQLQQLQQQPRHVVDPMDPNPQTAPGVERAHAPPPQQQQQQPQQQQQQQQQQQPAAPLPVPTPPPPRAVEFVPRTLKRNAGQMSDAELRARAAMKKRQARAGTAATSGAAGATATATGADDPSFSVDAFLSTL